MVFSFKHITNTILAIIISCSLSHAQESRTYQNLDYSQLQTLQDSAYDQNNLRELEKFILIHKNKAKRENNNIEIARSYFYKTIIETDSINLKYADSIIIITNESNHIAYPTQGYIRKGGLFYHMGKFDLSLDNYLLAFDLAVKKGNNEQIQLVTFMIAAIRNINGQPKEAMNMYQKSLSVLKKYPNYETDKYEDFILLIHNISLSHLRLKQLDSASYYSKLGLEASNKMSDSLGAIDFKIVNAQINFFNKDYQKVIDSISVYIGNYEKIDMAIYLYYLGKSHIKLNNSEQGIYYFKQIDTIISQNQDPFDEVKNVYQELILDASRNEEENQQLEYIEKLIYYDSIMSSYKANVFNTSTISYDIPILKKQKSEIERRLKNKSRLNLILIYLSLIGLISIIYFFVREKRLQLKIKRLLENSNKKLESAKDFTEEDLKIPKDIITTILFQLENFEKKLDYLDKEIDLPKLANNLDTNTSYLSMIINHYKQLSFPNYLKKLRIDYAVIELSTNPELLKYNYQGLADIFGFKTSESFSRAFYSQTGVHPSKIIKQLKKKINNDNL